MAGPFQKIPLNGADRSADLYLLRYGEDGRLRSPNAEAEIKARLTGATDISDVFYFAHGWNNIFAQALDRYRDFATGFILQRKEFQIPEPANYRPLLIGAIWPSTSFVMPREAGPEIAADPDPFGRQAAEVEELLDVVTSSLDDRQKDAIFTEAVDGRRSIDFAIARQVAEIAVEALRAAPDPDDGSPAPSVDELLKIWTALDGVTVRPVGPSAGFGTIRSGSGAEQPATAGISFDPRGLLRIASAWKMKSRAGTVGQNGVAPLIEHILGTEAVRLHLIGHSFGARVVLSALASSSAPRSADSMLLLQPAVNRWCFAANVAGTSRVGGYHAVLDKVRQPLLTTFSSHDDPLTKFFHLAMRGGHLGDGQPDVAAIGNTDLYGALGGFGPAGLAGLEVRMNAAVPGEERYPLLGGARVIAVNGGVEIDGRKSISGHGDISNPVTWWALHDLTRPD